MKTKDLTRIFIKVGKSGSIVATYYAGQDHIAERKELRRYMKTV